jgi:UDP-N-acetylglucosamine acyltransferase
MIHPTSIVEPGAQLGAGCEIHPYAIVKRGSILGERVVVHSFAVVGGDSQDLKFDPATSSGVRIGAATSIRENVTINRSNVKGTCTEIGANCLLMAGCHVGHDCIVGRHVVIGNAALLAGHVHVGDNAILGGGAGFHQFIRVGEGVMVGDGIVLTLDLPPFLLAVGRNDVGGLNLIGLRRSGVSSPAVQELKQAYGAVYLATGSIVDLAAAALAGGDYATPEARRFLGFFANSKRGFARARSGNRLQGVGLY